MNAVPATKPESTRTFSYKPRSPSDSQLYKIFAETLETFISRREIEGFPLPAYVTKELRDFLRCGIIQYGFVRCVCEACGKEQICGLSCKHRGFCPSCGAKRMAETAEHLIDNILPDVQYRQWIITYPHSLRFWMASNRKLFSKIQKISLDIITNFYREKALREEVAGPQTGAISFTHMFGSLLSLNIHNHSLFVDGVFEAKNDPHEKPKFKKLSPLTDDEVSSLTEKIAKRTIHYLQTQGYIENETPTDKLSEGQDPIIKEHESLSKILAASARGRIAFGKNAGRYPTKIGKGFGYFEEVPLSQSPLCFSVNGFSLHAQRKIKPNHRSQLEALLQYMGRSCISTERLTRNSDETFDYKLKRELSDGTRSIRLTGEEIIERIVSIIPLPRAHLVKYCGVFAPASPFRSQIILRPGVKKATKPIACDEAESKKHQGKDETKLKNTSWARLLARVFKLDISKCKAPGCGGDMVVIGVVFDPGEIQRYLDHVGINSRAPPILGPKLSQSQLEFAYDYGQ
jgi:hypothetical protein